MTQIIPSGPSPFDIVALLSTLQQQAIIRPNNPPPGIAGFLFDVPDEEETSLRAVITDNFVEANYAIQDHIALQPAQYTVRGFVAEVVAFQPQNPSTASVANPLPLNPNIEPELTPGAEEQQAYIESVRVENDRLSANENSLWDFYVARSGSPLTDTRQRRAFLYFKALFRARMLFTVETPWGVYPQMAIEQIRVVQGPDTRGESSFAVTFKEIQVAGAVTVQAGQLAGRAFAQGAPVTQNGTAGKAPVSTDERQSLLYRLIKGP